MSLLEKQKQQVVEAVMEEIQSFSLTDKNFDLSSIIENKVGKIIEITPENISEIVRKGYENKRSRYPVIDKPICLSDQVAHNFLEPVMRAANEKICAEIREEITSKYSIKIMSRD